MSDKIRCILDAKPVEASATLLEFKDGTALLGAIFTDAEGRRWSISLPATRVADPDEDDEDA